MFDELSELKKGLDASLTWGYYSSLKSGEERDTLGDDWFSAGEIGTASLNDEESVQELHQKLDAFSKTLKENPDDMRYKFVAVSSRLKVTPQNENDENDLIVLIQPNSSDVTLGDLKRFTAQVKSK